MSKSRILDSSYVKAIFFGLIVFAGVSGGIYLGYAFIGEAPTHENESEFRPVDVGSSKMTLHGCPTPWGGMSEHS